MPGTPPCVVSTAAVITCLGLHLLGICEIPEVKTVKSSIVSADAGRHVANRVIAIDASNFLFIMFSVFINGESKMCKFDSAKRHL